MLRNSLLRNSSEEKATSMKGDSHGSHTRSHSHYVRLFALHPSRPFRFLASHAPMLKAVRLLFSCPSDAARVVDIACFLRFALSATTPVLSLSFSPLPFSLYKYRMLPRSLVEVEYPLLCRWRFCPRFVAEPVSECSGARPMRRLRRGVVFFRPPSSSLLSERSCQLLSDETLVRHLSPSSYSRPASDSLPTKRSALSKIVDWRSHLFRPLNSAGSGGEVFLRREEEAAEAAEEEGGRCSEGSDGDRARPKLGASPSQPALLPGAGALRFLVWSL
mmetsp:Transcript_50059/g.150638  ORF Transcript_50059/g.150638 Transcript_50059/m.150638 type:complete len:275 (+) Transcript_50059:58-882(+)